MNIYENVTDNHITKILKTKVCKYYYIDNVKTDYIISENGDVFSLKTNRIKSYFVDKDGYKRIELSVNGKRIKKYIHRMVAETFIPIRIEGYDTVNHIDGDKQNNHYTNLEWCTPKYNTQHAIKSGLRNNNGERNGRSKYSDELIDKVRKQFKLGKSVKELSKLFNIDKIYLYQILNNKVRFNDYRNDS